MGKSCLVCNNKFRKGGTVSFHRLPKDKGLKAQWCKILGLDINELGPYEVICSEHFSPEDIISQGFHCYLRKESIPLSRTSNDSSSSSDKENIDRTQRITKSATTSSSQIGAAHLLAESAGVEEPNKSSSTSSLVPESEGSGSKSTSTASQTGSLNQQIKTRGQKRKRERWPRYFGDCSYDDMKNPTSAKKNWAVAKRTIRQLKLKVNKLQRETRALKSKIHKQNSLFTYLKKTF